MQNTKEISRDLDDDLELMEKKAWIYFGKHTNLVPHILSADEHMTIYRILEKEVMDLKKDDDVSEHKKKKLDYDAWKRGLVRILILAKEKLHLQKEKEKQLKENRDKKHFNQKGKEIKQRQLFQHTKKDEEMKEKFE